MICQRLLNKLGCSCFVAFNNFVSRNNPKHCFSKVHEMSVHFANYHLLMIAILLWAELHVSG